MTVVSIEGPDERAAWAAFCAGRAASPMDGPAWADIVNEAYGLTCHPLVTMDRGDVRGVLALYEVKHPFFGHFLTTAPFGTDGGLLSASPEATRELGGAARELADRLGVSYLCVRKKGSDLEGFQADHRFVTAHLDLTRGAAALWDALPATTRNQVRKGQKGPFQFFEGPDQFEDCCAVIRAHMRDLGSPWHSRSFCESLRRRLGPDARFIVLRSGRENAGAIILLTVGRIAFNIWAATRRAYNAACANYLLYWNMIELLCREGFHTLDMGRSPADSRTLAFKRNWGPEVLGLSYNYYLRTAKEIPFHDPRNPAFRLPILAWRNLPLAVTNWIGPKLIWGLP